MLDLVGNPEDRYSHNEAQIFIRSLHGKSEHELCKNGHAHMTKMADTPIYSKTFKILLLKNRKSYDLKI